jgi:glycosyltransferase involved in cell wall biosynthesis
MKLDACIITKDSADIIHKMLESIKPHVDKIYVLDTGSTDNTIEVLKEHDCIVDQITPQDNPEFFVEIDGQYNLKFAKARNRSFKPSKADWILWIDSDDELVTKVDLKELIAKAEENKATAIGCSYNYRIDNGKVTTSHAKQRLLKNGVYKWEKDEDNWIIHENIYPLKESLDIYTDGFWINHANPNFEKSAKRNVRALLWMSKQLPDDPRVWYLLGRDAGGAKIPELMEAALSKAIGMDLSKKDFKSACTLLAELYETTGAYQTSLKYAAMAHARDPLSPESNTMMAKYYLLLGDNLEAITFAERARQYKFNALDGADVMAYDYIKLNTYILVEAYERQEMYLEALEELKRLKPHLVEADMETFEHTASELIGKAKVQKLSETYKDTAQELYNQGKDPYEADKMLPETDFPLPAQIELRRALGDFEKHFRAIDFYCLNNFENWDPSTIIKKGGGGSETAVVELAKRFAAAGYTVTVWGKPIKDGSVFDGVTWRDVKQFPYEDHFDVLVSWRDVGLYKNFDIRANKKYLWLQDIMQAPDYTRDVVDQLDKIIVLSDYHRMTAPQVPLNKFYFTTNGINLDLIEEVEKEVGKIEREKGYCVNASSADRGLEHLVRFWKGVKKKAPHARLSWFYGWNSWDVFAQFEWSAKLKKQLIKSMKKLGINEGGRIGKKELYKEYLKAEYWVYPLIGPAETSCITAMEAQALGAIPITTGITALEETQQFGVKVGLDQFEDTLIKLLNKPEIVGEEEYREEMKKWARETFNWDRVANNWIKDLF